MSGSQSTAAQAVSFRNIPPNLAVPLFWGELQQPQTAANQQAQRVLIIGGTLNAVPLAPVFMPPPAGGGSKAAAQAAAATYGVGSMLSQMIGKYRYNDPFTEVWGLPMPDPSGGSAASATIVISGTASETRPLCLYLNGYLLQVGVTNGQAASAIATNVAAAYNAARVPVTAAASSGTVTLTSKHKLLAMNSMTLMANYLGSIAGEAIPAGLTVSISAFSGGAGVVDPSGIAAALGTMDFDFIVVGYNDSAFRTAVTALMSDSSGRWSYLSQLYGGIWAADVDTDSALLTLGGTMNDQHQVIWGAYGSPTPFWEAAAFATAVAVPSIVGQPNLPLTNLAVPGILAPPAGQLPSISTEQSELVAGISRLTWDRTGMCRITRVVTTYQTNSFGVADKSYQDVGTLYTLMQVLRRLQALVTQRYGNVLLVPDGTPIGAGIPAVSPRTVKADLIADYTIMEDLGWVQNSAAFATGLIVVINATNPKRLDVLFDPQLVSGLEIFAVATQFSLTGSTQSATLAA